MITNWVGERDSPSLLCVPSSWWGRIVNKGIRRAVKIKLPKLPTQVGEPSPVLGRWRSYDASLDCCCRGSVRYKIHATTKIDAPSLMVGPILHLPWPSPRKASTGTVPSAARFLRLWETNKHVDFKMSECSRGPRLVRQRRGHSPPRLLGDTKERPISRKSFLRR